MRKDDGPRVLLLAGRSEIGIDVVNFKLQFSCQTAALRLLT